MKRTFYYSLAAALILIAAVGNVSAQDIKGGVVKYQQTTKYDFDSIFNPRGDAEPRIVKWLAKMPKEGKQGRVLYFTEETALYEEDLTVKNELPEQRGNIEGFAALPPKPDIKKVLYDFVKNERIQQVMFMTRNFLISDSIKKKAWKLSNKRVKVLDYTCMGAELKKGDQTITAWYAPEIPISTGPDEFFGLPGLILAIEINGEYAFVATSIDLTPPPKGVFSKPDEGKKINQEEFNKIVAEKIKEHKETRARRRRR